MDITKQLTEYNVEYNVLQEEISTTNHHLEMLKREKAQSQHLEQQLQFAQSSIAQLEQTRSSQQAQITALQSQVQSLELTIQTMGRFVSQLAEQNVDLDLPGDVRRILTQLDDLERQKRKKQPLFTERKIGKSISVNSHLGFQLKVLEELNEKDEHGSPQKTQKTKTPFFENTYEQLRQQQQQRAYSSSSNASYLQLNQQQQPQQRPNRLLDTAITVAEVQHKLDELKLPEHVDKFVSSIKSPLEVDSGVGTPLSPPSISSSSSLSNSSVTSGSLFSRMGYKSTPAVLSPLSHRHSYTPPMSSVTPTTVKVEAPSEEMHPLSMVGDVNVRFNGTTQLKSIRPMHYVRTQAANVRSSVDGTSDERS